mmetsp:Transcript_25725/g.54110  ORF Transcript_25725/g.54110 Transcript_25725/m.54110 type:complete len:288 (-) Transcript_25725:195-1058(-)
MVGVLGRMSKLGSLVGELVVLPQVFQECMREYPMFTIGSNLKFARKAPSLLRRSIAMGRPLHRHRRHQHRRLPLQQSLLRHPHQAAPLLISQLKYLLRQRSRRCLRRRQFPVPIFPHMLPLPLMKLRQRTSRRVSPLSCQFPIQRAKHTMTTMMTGQVSGTTMETAMTYPRASLPILPPDMTTTKPPLPMTTTHSTTTPPSPEEPSSCKNTSSRATVPSTKEVTTSSTRITSSIVMESFASKTVMGKRPLSILTKSYYMGIILPFKSISHFMQLVWIMKIHFVLIML